MICDVEKIIVAAIAVQVAALEYEQKDIFDQQALDGLRQSMELLQKAVRKLEQDHVWL